MKAWSVLIAFALASGCTGIGVSGSTVFEEPKARPTVAIPARLPEQLGVDLLDTGRSATLTFAGARDGVARWSAPDGSALALADGVVIRTYGLGFDLVGSDATETRLLLTRRASGGATRVHTYLDGENRIIRRAFLCDVSVERPSGIEQRVTENCAGSDVFFENSYVLGPDGRILSSRQWIGPEIGPVRISRLARHKTEGSRFVSGTRRGRNSPGEQR